MGLTVSTSWDFTKEKFELFLWSPFRNENLDYTGAPNENIVQNHFNIALLHVF